MTPKRPVVAIPPSYNQDESLELHSTANYLKYLEDNGATCVMTTAGTSQFNFLNLSEIHEFNRYVMENFSGQKILGIPALPSIYAESFAKEAAEYLDENSTLMALYPDRFYGENTIRGYIENVCDATERGIYLHTQKMRSGISGDWNYTANILNLAYQNGDLIGIKEEHPNLQESYNFIRGLNNGLDIIVAGGSMRRFQFLESAGANSFLSGMGNLFPSIENDFLDSDHEERIKILQKESKFFNVFMANGWHRSLRASLKIMNLTCLNNRDPWPEKCTDLDEKLANMIEGIKINEK